MNIVPTRLDNFVPYPQNETKKLKKKNTSNQGNFVRQTIGLEKSGETKKRENVR